MLTPNQECIEENKINIVFSIDKLNEVSQIIDTIILGADYFINAESSEGMVRLNVKDIEYFEAFGNDVYAIVGKKRYLVFENYMH